MVPEEVGDCGGELGDDAAEGGFGEDGEEKGEVGG